MANEQSKENSTPIDYWSSQRYATAASFVPRLTQKVLHYLDPQPTDRILDIGCGDGKFTANFASSVAEVYGVDSSPSFIASAIADHGAPNVQFKLVDCRYLERDQLAMAGCWDKVVSNAALHWILHDSVTRLNTLTACYKALKPGGSFVFEMGGAGNVAEAHTALLSVLVQHGCTIAQARQASPWFFPSDTWMRQTLEHIGFQVDAMELEYRPTKLTDNENGGLEGWLRLMGGTMLDILPGDERERALHEVCDLLDTILTRVEDGSQWLGYVRLRGRARKPA